LVEAGIAAGFCWPASSAGKSTMRHKSRFIVSLFRSLGFSGTSQP
jgi:hypothetical protein